MKKSEQYILKKVSSITDELQALSATDKKLKNKTDLFTGWSMEHVFTLFQFFIFFYFLLICNFLKN